MQQLFHGLSAAPGVGIGNIYKYAPVVADDAAERPRPLQATLKKSGNASLPRASWSMKNSPGWPRSAKLQPPKSFSSTAKSSTTVP